MQTFGQIIGQRMSQIREARGWSQEAVAKNLEISSTAYAKIERGETDVPLSRLQAIAKALQVDMWAFFAQEKAVNMTIIGDVSENSGHLNNQHYNNDFEKERDSYKAHIADLQKQVEALNQTVASMQRTIEVLAGK
jgi:transcriptional regulator with XRE-family HTH domain